MRASFFLLVLAIVAVDAFALIEVGGKGPVTDSNWPAGSVELANLKTRIAWWEGPPYGGGETHFLYRGDAKAFQEALDAFAKIKAPQLQLSIHEGPAESPFLGDSKEPAADKHYDWSFTVWNPQSFHHLYNNPQSFFGSDDPSERFRKSVDAPRMDVYVAGEDGKGIDWKQVKAPANVTVADERATSAGYGRQDGSVIRADVYDMITSKPIGSAVVAISRSRKQGDYERVADAKTDGSGHVEMKRIGAESFRVTVSADGYVSRVVGHESFGANTLKQYTVYLAPPANISGVVLDTDDTPVSGATVRADHVLSIDGRGYLTGETLKATTDAGGHFQFAQLPRGYLQFYTYDKSHHPLDIFKQIQAPSENITLRVTATGTIEGKVVHSDGSPVTKGNVHVDPEGEPLGKWGGSMNLKADGTFRFENVPPGKYTANTKFVRPNPAGDPNAKQIEVKIGQTTTVELIAK